VNIWLKIEAKTTPVVEGMLAAVRKNVRLPEN
jgi:hypothetical protein